MENLFMKKIKYFYILFLLTFYGCIDLPSEYKAPIVPYEGVTIPIVDKSYTLWDAIKKDTTNITKSSSNNLLIFRQTKTLSKITIGDKIASDPSSSSTTLKKDEFKAKISRQENTIAYQWAPGYGPGQNVPFFPAVTGTEEMSFPSISEINYATIKNGSIILSITNNFPLNSGVNLTLSNIVIKNSDNSGNIANYNQNVDIAPQTTKELQIPLIQNAVIKKDIKFSATISSTQSTGPFITPAYSAKIVIKESYIYIKDGSVIIPGQAPIVNSDSIKFDANDSLKVYSAIIKNGSLKIDIDNKLDFSANIKIHFDDIYKSPISALNFDTTVVVQRKTKTSINFIFNNYQIRSQNPNTQAISFIRYSVTAQFDSSANSNDYRTISINDYITASSQANKFTLKEVKAQIKPTILDPISESNNFETKDLNNLEFNKILFDDNNLIKLKFNMVTNIPVKITGQISSPEATEKINLNLNINKNNPTANILLTNFLNSISGKIIKTIDFNIKPTFNPNYEVVTITDTNSVTPSYTVEIPLKISINGGSLKDTTDKLDPPSQDDRKKANDIKKVRLFLDIENGIPAAVYMKVSIYDKNGNKLFDIPVNNNELKSDSLYVPAAYVDNNGKVTQAYKKFIIQELSTKEVDKYFDAYKAIIEAKLETSNSNNSVRVEFTTDQTIKIKGYVKMDVDLNPDNF
jgi:hypothetical protein